VKNRQVAKSYFWGSGRGTQEKKKEWKKREPVGSKFRPGLARKQKKEVRVQGLKFRA